MTIKTPSGTVDITGVLFCPSLKGSFLGVKQEVKKGVILAMMTTKIGTRLIFANGVTAKCEVDKDGLDVLPLQMNKKKKSVNSIYGEHGQTRDSTSTVYEAPDDEVEDRADLNRWHERMGHRDKRMLRELQGKVKGMNIWEPKGTTHLRRTNTASFAPSQTRSAMG